MLIHQHTVAPKEEPRLLNNKHFIFCKQKIKVYPNNAVIYEKSLPEKDVKRAKFDLSCIATSMDNSQSATNEKIIDLIFHKLLHSDH